MTTNNRDSEICDRILQLRIEHFGARGNSAFARALNISPSSYDYYEKGRLPPVELLIRISEVTGADLRWLLTGKEVQGQLPAGHPAIARVAKLLAQKPEFAIPLAAFLDLLSETAALKTAAGVGAGGSAQPPPSEAAPAESSAESQNETERQTAAAQGTGPQMKRVVVTTSSDTAAGPERQGWIPILGRSAAGIPHFWQQTGQTDGGATALSDLVAHMRPRKARRVHEAQATGELAANGSSAQLVLLDAPEPPGTAEFVIAEHIAGKYDVVFAVRIDGASMAPEILHGDVVILSPACPAEQGKPAVVQLADQIGVTCKLFRRDGNNLHLIPINPAFAPTEHDMSDLRWALKVIARVRAS